MRLEVLGTFIQKTLKVKPEKWMRVLATEDYRTIVFDFLERPEAMLLIVMQVIYLSGGEGLGLNNLK